MNRALRFLLLLSFVMLALGQTVVRAQSGAATTQPDVVIQNLYREVVARHPLGIPSGTNWEVFAPFLSKGLLRKIALGRSCAKDWIRQNGARVIKSPIEWSEVGFFSGAQELSAPSSFQIHRIETTGDGSFRVYVELTESPPNEKPWNWNVAVQLKTEAKGLVVDDVIYLKEDEGPPEYRLSEILTAGCNGSHWVGDKQ